MESQVTNFTVDLKQNYFSYSVIVTDFFDFYDIVTEVELIELSRITSSSGPSIALKYPTCDLHLMQEKHFL